MDVFLQDVRYALRGLRRSPGFAAAAILTLALGTGATTAIFSVVRSVLLSPLPYSDPVRGVMVWSRWKAFPKKTWVADADVFDYRRMCPSLESVAAWWSGEANLTGDGDPVRVGMAAITANTFETLGARPHLGRSFTSEEDLPGGPPVVILSYGLWQRRYAGDSGILSRAVDVDGVRTRVVGVMPRGFALPTDFTVDSASPSQLWVPLQINPPALTRNHGLSPGARDGGAPLGRGGADAPGRIHGRGSVRALRDLLRRGDPGWRAPGAPPRLRRGRVPDAHGLRQRRQPVAREGRGEAARDLRARR